MPRKTKTKIVSTRTLSNQDGKLVREDNKVSNSSSSNYNGQFVSNIALIVMLFMMLVLVAGSLKHEPMEMVVGVAQRVSNYGEGFKGDLTKFSGAIDTIKRDESQTYTIYFQGHYVEVPKWFTQGLNGAIDIFKFLTAVPVAFTSLALRFLWMFVDVIGFCIL